MLKKIISGGQTGADRAGLDVAIEKGIPHGGWIPKGRKTEDGTLPNKYNLSEMTSTSYPKRTEKNILDSDGTLIISHGKITGGSSLTIKLSKQHEKPWIHLDMNDISTKEASKQLTRWIKGHQIQILNVAGPRATKDPTIHTKASEVLKKAIELL